MWKALKYIIVYTYLLCPSYLRANEDGTKQVSSLKLVTEQGEVLSMNAPGGKLIDITFIDHSERWSIDSKDIDLHGGSLALHAFKLDYSEFKDKDGTKRIVNVLSIPVIFSTSKDGDTSYDQGRLEINFYEGGDASVDLWREQFNDRPIEHVDVKRVE